MRNILLKSVIVCISLITFFSISCSQVKATILFQEDFNDGNDDGWTSTRGPDIWKVVGGKYGARIEGPGTLIDAIGANVSIQNYIIELDFFPLVGSDKNIDFRWSGNETSHEVHFNYDAGGTAYFKGKSISYRLENNIQYYIKVILEGPRTQFFVDGDKLFDEINPTYQFPGSEQVGLRISTGSDFPTEVYFDNIVVTSLDPEEPNLNVLSLKQNDPFWGNQEYNSASSWSPSSPSISSWGCAMTSAAMVFKFHGINNLPDGILLDPGTLNSWLKSQSDGFVGSGLVNWLALSRLSKLAKFQNPGFAFEALEYQRIDGEDKDQLTTDIENSIPGILEELGHFVVGKGVSGDTFLINDPFHDRADLIPYGNTFLSLGRYLPSNTDLSYFMILLDPSLSIVVKNSNGVDVGNAFLQQPYKNAVSGSETNGNAVKIFYFEKPESGNYLVKISSLNTSLYSYKIYAYDSSGNVKIFDQNGLLSNNKPEDFTINFNKQSSNSSQSLKVVTFDSVLTDIEELKKLGLITNKTIAQQLINLIKDAQKEFQKNRKQQAGAKLKAFEILLNSSRPILIKESAYQLLLSDLTALKKLL